MGGDFANGLKGDDSFDPNSVRQSVADKYKALAPHMANSEVIDSSGKPGAGDRHLEFYPPYEEENPRPGKITFELFDKMNRKQAEDAVAADALHHLGGYRDAEHTKPVDPQWLKMRNELMSMRTPAQVALDAKNFASNQGESHGPEDTMDDWMDRSQADAYVRGGIFPAQNPEWNQKGTPISWTPEQLVHFDKMRAYLTNGATEPPPFQPDPSADRDQQIKRQFGM